MSKRKIAALGSILFLVVMAVRAAAAPSEGFNAAVNKIELFLAFLAVVGAWILFFVDHGYSEKTGDSYVKNKILGREQSQSILQSYDKHRRDQRHAEDAKRNRAKLPRSTRPEGIVFGRAAGQWVYSPAVGAAAPHAFVYGPTGAGKTQDVILPTIAAWPKNCHIFGIDVSGDISGTIDQNSWMRPAYRALDFTSWAAATRFDVFATISHKADQLREEGADDDYIHAVECTEIEKIALCLLPPPKASDSSNSYFVDGGRDLLCGALLAGFFGGRGFVETLRFVCEYPLTTALKSIEKSGVREAVVKVRQFAGQSEKNVSGVRGEAVKAAERITKNAIAARVLTPPKPYENAVLLSPDAIEQNDIFVKIKMTDIDILSSVIGLVITQVVDYFYTRPLDFAAEHPILMACDELASYCRYWPSIDNDVRNLRKFGIRMLMCSQDFTSIDSQIGKSKRQTIIANTGYKIILGSYVSEDQKELSDLVGREEQLKRANTFSPYGTPTYTDRWEQQAAIPPEDFGTLAARHQIVVISPDGWERIDSAPFYRFKDMLNDGSVFSSTHKSRFKAF